MWGVAIVGVAYLLLLFRFGRHAFNSAMIPLAGLTMLFAWGIEDSYNRMQAGETAGWFHGRLPTYQFGQFTTFGILLIGFELVLGVLWYWLAFKIAGDAEYKSRTPAGAQG